MVSDKKVKRLQVEFHSTLDLEHCLQYVRQLGLRVQPAVFRRYHESQRNLTTNQLHSLTGQWDSEAWDSQGLGSQIPASQLSNLPLCSQSLESQPLISPTPNYSIDLSPSQANTMTLKKDLQLDGLCSRPSSKIPSIFDHDSCDPPSTKLSIANTNQLASMCDNEIIEYVSLKLKDDAFKAFCCRLDKIIHETAKNSTK